MKEETDVIIKFTVPSSVYREYEPIINNFINSMGEIELDVDVVEDYKGYPSVDITEY